MNNLINKELTAGEVREIAKKNKPSFYAQTRITNDDYAVIAVNRNSALQAIDEMEDNQKTTFLYVELCNEIIIG